MALFNRTMDNAAKARIAAYEAEIQANAVDVDWMADTEEQEASSIPMVDQVYEELKANIENNNMVCLDNVNLKKLGITEKQFSGYCSQLAQRGVYYTQADWAGWAEVK